MCLAIASRSLHVLQHVCIHVQEHQSSSADQCFKSTIWGPSLDSHDKVLDGVSLPEVEIGEWLCIKSMGAYSEAIASRFNAMPVHENYYCVSEAKRYLKLTAKLVKRH